MDSQRALSPRKMLDLPALVRLRPSIIHRVCLDHIVAICEDNKTISATAAPGQFVCDRDRAITPQNMAASFWRQANA